MALALALALALGSSHPRPAGAERSSASTFVPSQDQSRSSLSGPVPAKRRKVRESSNMWNTHIDNSWQSNDRGAGLEVLGLLSQPALVPSKPHLRQLLALALSPRACLPPPPAVPPSTTASPEPLSHPSFSSPDALRQLRTHALAVLRDLGRRFGAGGILRAVADYGAPSFAGSSPAPKSSDGEESEGEEEEEETELTRAGRRVALCEDLWDVLCGGAERHASRKGKERAVRDPEGWDLLFLLVELWEEEILRKGTPRSLLGQFRPQVGDDTMREVSKAALELILGAFPDSHALLCSEGNEGPLSVQGRRKIARRFLALLVKLAERRVVDPDALARDLSLRIEALDADSFRRFALATSPPLFRIKLLSQHLALHGKPSPSRATTPPPANSQSASQQTPASPSRRSRPLAPSASSTNLASPLKDGSTPSSQTLKPAWTVPKVHEILKLFELVPAELVSALKAEQPAGAKRPSSPTATKSIALRKPRAQKRAIDSDEEDLTPRPTKKDRWEHVQRAAAKQRFVKETLLEALGEWCALGREEGKRWWSELGMERVDSALREVESEVERAGERLEG